MQAKLSEGVFHITLFFSVFMPGKWHGKEERIVWILGFLKHP